MIGEQVPRSPGRKGLATRARILVAASECFAEGGRNGTTTRAIAAAAGVNIATLAWHFKDKDGLHEAVIDSVLREWVEIPFELESGGEPSDRIRSLLRQVFGLARARRLSLRILLRAVLDEGGLSAELRSRYTPQLLRKAVEIKGFLGDVPLDPLFLLTMNHLIARYAVSDLADVAVLLGRSDPEEAVVEHLGDVAVRLLGLASST